jgi:hypothetical protein
MLVGLKEPIFLVTHVQMFEVASSCVWDSVSMEGVGESATIVVQDTIQYLQQTMQFVFFFKRKPRWWQQCQKNPMAIMNYTQYT